MSPPDPLWRDPAYLLDMLIAARKVLEFTRGVTWQSFERDDVLQNAAMYQLQIVGEAARKVSTRTRDAHSEVPWHDIVGMRHRLVHDYQHIDARKVWDTIENDLAPLISMLEVLVPPDSP